VVVDVDVGYGQLAWRIRQDERVRVHDRTNVRQLTPELVGGPVDLVVGDLSFISLELVLDALLGVCRPDADLALMVKPQFEVGKDRVGKGGVVRDPALRAEAVTAVADAAARRGWGAEMVTTSPLPGPSGNVEFFLWLRRGAAAVDAEEIERVVRAAAPSGVPGERVDP
jgi:23S rRNA (cytidine1920-2'-O)/16S rRNA (cytidine1409-2'-O)-methyltransferase